MRKCLICILLALCLVSSAMAEGISMPSTCVSTGGEGSFSAVYDEESGNTYYLLPSVWGLAFYRHHPQNGWKKLANVSNAVWAMEYSDGWIFYKKSGGWSGWDENLSRCPFCHRNLVTGTIDGTLYKICPNPQNHFKIKA